MLSLKDSVLRQWHKRAILELLAIQALACFCVVLKRVDCAIDIKRGIGLGGSHVPKTYPVILVAVGGKRLGDFAQQFGALLVSQLLQRPRSALARELERLCKIKALRTGMREVLAVDWIDQRNAFARALLPFSGNVVG